MHQGSSDIILPTITVAISTMIENLDNFISNFSFASLHEANEVLIIIQGTLNKKPTLLFNNNYTIIEDDGEGISRSRNIALLHASCDYVWFMDDDVLLNNDAIITVKNYISQYNSDIFTIRMKEYHGGRPYKNYSRKHRLNRRDIVGISSAEIIVSRKFLTQSHVRFNEFLGLGTQYPSCEENIFLLDLFDLGAKLIHIPAYVQTHRAVDRTIHFKDPNILFAKGVFCKRYNGFMGVFIMLLWFCKSLLIGANVKNSFNLIYGYNNADTILE